MKVSVQTDAQAWKVQADAGQAATFGYGPCCIITLCCLLRPCCIKRCNSCKQGLWRLPLYPAGEFKCFKPTFGSRCRHTPPFC